MAAMMADGTVMVDDELQIIDHKLWRTWGMPKKWMHGPFTAEPDPHSKKNRWRVMNAKGSRIFRGTCKAGKRFANRLNMQYAEWLMVKP